MRSFRRSQLAMAGLTAIALLATACGGDDADTTAATDTTTDTDTDTTTDTTADTGDDATGDLSGQIVVSGSSTVEPITALNAELFQEQNPGVQISVDGPGTGDGFERFCQGETDISDASRPIKDEEAQACADAGIEFTELKVGIDGISILTNPANEAVECVDFAALYAMTGPESEGFETWADAASLADEIGSTEPGSFPDAPLTVVGPGEESGTYDTYVELVIEEFGDRIEEQGVEAATRADYQASANDNVIVQGIQGSDTSLGWVGYAFYVENQDSLKALQVSDGESGCVEPNDETIASGEYPLSRPLFIYVNNQKLTENPTLQAFVDFYLSDEGRQSVSEVGYVQLTDDEWQATVDAYRSVAG